MFVLMERLIKESKEASEYLSHISLDCAVFCFQGGQLKVLLLKSRKRQQWMLPGGFVRQDEDVKDAAHRALKERSGAQKVFLQEFAVFGSPARTKGNKDLFDAHAWLGQRFISIGFYALVNYLSVTLVADHLSEACEWCSVDHLPEMALDHKDILNQALESLRQHLNFKPIGYNLLQEEFTMPELQRLYETILGKKLHRGNFARKILSFNILEKLEEPRKGGAHKSPNLYRFNHENYKAALENGFQPMFN